MTLTDASGGMDQLLNQGGIGLLAFFAVTGIAVLWRRDVRLRDEDIRITRERADRLERELSQLNATVQEQTLHALNEATRAVADAMARMRGTS